MNVISFCSLPICFSSEILSYEYVMSFRIYMFDSRRVCRLSASLSNLLSVFVSV